MFKQTINSTLLVLVFLLLITPLIHAQTDYFTGYLDLDIINLDNQKDLKFKPDLSFYSFNSTNENYFFEIKYDSNQTLTSNKRDEQLYLDQSKLLKDKSNQKEFLYLSYDSKYLKYGEVKTEINNPIFVSYYDNFKGIKTGVKRKNLILEYIYSKSSYNKVRDILINPDSTEIFLKYSNIKKNSENIQVKVFDNKNNLIKLVRLTKYNDYDINYKEGKIIFNPLIFFANNLEYNYELTLDYKIKQNITKDIKISKIKKRLSNDIVFKYYNINKKDKKKLSGFVLDYSNDSRGSINFEYQRLKQKMDIRNISLDNGQNYFKNNLYDKKEKSFGLKYNKLFKNHLLINGYSIRRDIFNNLTGRIKEEENHFFLDKKLNKKYRTQLEYKHFENNLGNKEYSYNTNLITKLNERLILNTGYKLNHNDRLSIAKRSLSNDLELEYSENLVISWGILQNMVNSKDYYQAFLKYSWDNNIFDYQNKVIELENRLVNYNFQNKNFKLYKNTLYNLENNKKIKTKNGLRYKINKLSSIGYQNNDYYINELDKEEVYKYNLKINNELELSLNQINYLKNINNKNKQKRKAIRSILNYNKDKMKFSIRFEDVKNRESTYLKNSTNYKYSNFINKSLFYSLKTSNHISKDLIKNKIVKNKENEINFKYRPLNSTVYIYYKYLDKSKIQTDILTQKKSLINNSINLNYIINDRLSLNTCHNKLFEKLLTSNSLIINNIVLNRYTLSFKAKEYWTIDLEYRTLFDNLNNINDSGYLLGLNKQVNDKVSLGISYNFTDFNNEITELTYDNKGLSLNINYIF